MLSHSFGQDTKTDGGEEVDAEASLLRIVRWEHANQCRLELVGLHPLGQFRHAYACRKVFNKNLDKDTRRRCGVVFIELDDMEDGPFDRIARQKMAKELSNNPKTVCFVSVDRLVILREHRREKVPPQSIQLAEAFANQAVEFVEGAFLAATFDDHRRQLFFSASWKVDTHQFVASFFETTRRHDGKIDGSTQIDQISVRLILDLHRFLFLIFFIVTALI